MLHLDTFNCSHIVRITLWWWMYLWILLILMKLTSWPQILGYGDISIVTGPHPISRNWLMYLKVQSHNCTNIWSTLVYQFTHLQSRMMMITHLSYGQSNMPDEIVSARIMKDFGFRIWKVTEGYISDNDYGLPGPVMRSLCIYLVSTTEVPFNPTDYKGAQCPISPFTPRWPRDELPFCQGVCWCLTLMRHPHWNWTQTMKRRISLQLTLMTWYGLKSLCC